MEKKKNNLGLGLDCIIDGDSEEAKAIYKEMGWTIDDENNKLEEKNDDLMKQVLWFFAAATLAWFCITIPNSQIRAAILTFIACYGFIRQVCSSKCI